MMIVVVVMMVEMVMTMAMARIVMMMTRMVIMLVTTMVKMVMTVRTVMMVMMVMIVMMMLDLVTLSLCVLLGPGPSNTLHGRVQQVDANNEHQEATSDHDYHYDNHDDCSVHEEVDNTRHVDNHSAGNDNNDNYDDALPPSFFKLSSFLCFSSSFIIFFSSLLCFSPSFFIFFSSLLLFFSLYFFSPRQNKLFLKNRHKDML